MNDEYLEGRFAYREGADEDENPYPAHGYDCEEQRQHDDWQSGWYSIESERR
jgi:hypothetical protein